MSKPNYSRPTKAIIDRKAFQKNIDVIQQHCPNSNLILVIKANAYGHGMVEMASAAQAYELAVAIPEELLTLRQAGIKNRVWVLQGFFDGIPLSEKNVIWVIHSLWQLDLIKLHLSRYPDQQIDICFKIDSGMHRLGLSTQEFTDALRFVEGHSNINLIATMTHFANSDLPSSEDVMSQILFFDKLIETHQLTDRKQTLSNSGGICFYPQAHRDWVRPGIMLYGSSPSESGALPFQLEPVMSFESAIVALHSVKAGEGVGYGHKWVAQRDSVIATVAVGYADGYPRHAPNGTPVGVFVGGQFFNADLVGRVSMDMITIDVTDFPGVVIGDRVELWGKHISVNEVARLAGSISYQLFTSLSPRVMRLYSSI